MGSHGIQQVQIRDALIDRFAEVCRADERVLAAWLGGSYARGTADAHSDLDLCLVTTDQAYEDFLAGREAFIRRLGEPLFLESFDCAHVVFFIFADGTECELAVGRESRFDHIHSGPYRVLLDRKGILAGAVFPRHTVDRAEQLETLRRLVYWFWHDLSHVTTALARGQLWWAYGQLELLRRMCVNLARLGHDFSAAVDGYDKVDEALPSGRLALLEPTLCPFERDAMIEAARAIVRLYRDLARPLARTHGVPYPDRLDRVMYERLENLRAGRLA